MLDLLRSDVRVACSSPTKEKASFGVYSETLCNLARSESELQGKDGDAVAEAMIQMLTNNECVHSGRIHHREIPELIAYDQADVAPMYYHLALQSFRKCLISFHWVVP